MEALKSGQDQYVVKSVVVPGGELIISKPSVEDAADIVDFLNRVAGETDFLTFGLNEFPLSVAEEKASILACQEQNASLMLIGRLHGHIVTQLFIERSSKPRLMHIGDVGIAVSKDHWGKSIGKQMMVAAIALAQQSAITKLQLQVRVDNVRAVQLYEKLGFTIEGTIKRAMKIGELYFDDYIMGLAL